MFKGALERFTTVDDSLVRDVADSRRFVWLGSGISRDQVPDLVVIMRTMLLELRDRAYSGAEQEIHREALIGILERYLGEEVARYTANPQTWEPISTEPLRNFYSDVVGTRVGQKPSDYLLIEIAQLVKTYGAPDIRPGPIHYYLAILIAEGMLKHLASGNWDGLVELALSELTSTPEWLDVYVIAEDRRNERGFATLAKFHGCAVLALANPESYQDKIVATRAQISRFSSKTEFDHMRTWLAQLTEQDRSMVLGLSIQDSDLLNVFTKAAEAHPWRWDPDRPAYVFAQPKLRDEQLDVLENCYNGDFDEQRELIVERSTLGDYAGPVVAAITWRSLTLKTLGMLARAEIASPDIASELTQGIEQLAIEIPRRLGYSETRLLDFLVGPYSAMIRDYYGSRAFPGQYVVAVRGSLSHVATDPSVPLLANDLLACAIGFIGWGLATQKWDLALAGTGPDAKLELVKAPSASVGLRIVRGATDADEILKSPDWVHGDGHRAMLYMHDRPPSTNRSSSSRLGGRRRGGSRAEVWWRDLTADVDSMHEASDRLLSVVGV